MTDSPLTSRRSSQRRPTRPRWRWRIALSAVAVAAVVAAGTLAAPALAGLQIRVADGSAVEIGGSTSAVLVPEGWFIDRSRAGFLTVTTPDRSLAVEMSAAEDSPLSVLERVSAPLESRTDAAQVGRIREEVLASGVDIVHADVGPRAVAAALGEGPVVAVSAVVADDRTMAAYRRSMAEILEAVRP
ncbi:hypothetical protein [Microbacterium sp. RU33B]|uniref:hypothetical protein n=1 Tax=Microbacterium sp. RU33B TaxID=1907390 RepID=UPI00095A9D3F|nr:hypothetical protein [Microbacterium sp. RU33B]SIT66511.1 hypothetical protein SAMN05880545_0004 [Microbacterium sp. RU33B]